MYAKYMKKRGGVVETAAADAPEAGDELKVAH
jgi:2-keto-3-deoxygluconate permease